MLGAYLVLAFSLEGSCCVVVVNRNYGHALTKTGLLTHFLGFISRPRLTGGELLELI
jgi:hypothetical protein